MASPLTECGFAPLLLLTDVHTAQYVQIMASQKHLCSFRLDTGLIHAMQDFLQRSHAGAGFEGKTDLVEQSVWAMLQYHGVDPYRYVSDNRGQLSLPNPPRDVAQERHLASMEQQIATLTAHTNQLMDQMSAWQQQQMAQQHTANITGHPQPGLPPFSFEPIEPEDDEDEDDQLDSEEEEEDEDQRDDDGEDDDDYDDDDEDDYDDVDDDDDDEDDDDYE